MEAQGLPLLTRSRELSYYYYYYYYYSHIITNKQASDVRNHKKHCAWVITAPSIPSGQQMQLVSLPTFCIYENSLLLTHIASSGILS